MQSFDHELPTRIVFDGRRCHFFEVVRWTAITKELNSSCKYNPPQTESWFYLRSYSKNISVREKTVKQLYM